MIRRIIQRIIDGVTSIGVSAIVLSMVASMFALSYQPKQVAVEIEPIEYYKQIKYEPIEIVETKSHATTLLAVAPEALIAEANKQPVLDTKALADEVKADKKSGEYKVAVLDPTPGTKESISRQAEQRKATQNALLQIDNPDVEYKGTAIQLSAGDRDFVERLVQGEAGAEGYEGAALVAQAIRDTMIADNYTVNQVYVNLKYTGRVDRGPNEDVKRAVAYIFDQGGSAVQHRIIYFYAPSLVKSKFHETQVFVIEHNGHRVFDRRN